MKYSLTTLEASETNVTLKIGAIISLTTFLILFLLEPFGEVNHGYYLSGILRILSYAITSGAIFIFSELFLLPVILKSKLNSLRIGSVIWNAALLLLVTTGMFICKNLWMNFSVFTFQDYGIMIYRVFSIGIFPFAFLIIYIQYTSRSENNPEEVIFTSNDQNPEHFKISVSNVIVITSEENYISIHYLKSGKLKKKLIRNSLTKISDDLDIPFIRVHRSHIVNMQNIQGIDGNSQGLTLTMNSCHIEFKVSRSYLSLFNDQWKKFSANP